ncbi:MAG TPA: DUF1254 domain-containing protein [Terriglobales bacterium]|nr:DUF1254 domain-containing protein [Terriglobales bacterium]
MKNTLLTTNADEAYQLGIEAYIYFYPLVLMDITRRVMTNVPPGVKPGMGPMNKFWHMRAYPAADMREVVRPNFDTLYSIAWVDLTKEPMIVSAQDTQGRYYMLPMLDMWTDVFAVPGKRTSGTAVQHYAVVPPGWKGQLPEGVKLIQCPTSYFWIVGRTQTNGPADYAFVNKIQDGYAVTPLSRWGKEPEPVTYEADASVDMKTDPMKQLSDMAAKDYFTYAAELMKLHPPHVTDWSTIARLARIGIVPGKSFAWESLSPAVQQSLGKTTTDALQEMHAKFPSLTKAVNGWQVNTDSMGVYGNFYLKRAIVALIGLGANQPEDAVYPLNISDADGETMRGENNYILHFDKQELPPVEAFWSVTMYDEEGYQVPNPINRFAIGDRDSLKYNADGSLDLFIQHQNPGPERESNWLPSPASGVLGVTMRLYAPRTSVTSGIWAPPAIRCVRSKSATA